MTRKADAMPADDTAQPPGDGPAHAAAPHADPDSAPLDRDLFGRPPKHTRDWSHRRGEPRGLALGWTLYLMGATAGSLAPVISINMPDSGVYRPAARTLTVLIIIGLCVLWPMLRAAQEPSARPTRDTFRDLVILLVPAMTLIAPQVMLAQWSVEVVSAAALLVVAWALLVGVWLRLTMGRPEPGNLTRVLAAGGPIVLVGVVPWTLWALGLLDTTPPDAAVTRGWMLSPATSVWEVLRDRLWSGVAAAITPAHWSWIWSLLATAVVGHIAAGMAMPPPRPYRP